MTYSWQIPKYNPAFRSVSGRYLRDEWTSVFDVGKQIGGTHVASEEYLAVESAYTNTALMFVEECKISGLRAVGVEFRTIPIPDRRESSLRLADAHHPHEGEELSGKELERVIRGVLRE